MDKREKIRRGIMLGLAGLMALILVLGKNEKEDKMETTNVENHTPAPVSTGAAVISTPPPTPTPEHAIYSYLQGPKSWKEKRPWSGKWGKEIHDGSSFGSFGCGFCCMANIYSTITENKCTPLDIYERAKKVSFYGGGGAISWKLMRKTMADIGFTVELGEKPPTYGEFADKMKQTQAMLVLVSSYNDDSYWKDTPGHYVTLFMYDEGKQDVFLADSGDPEHNRHRVSLKTIYKALKTSSDFQYMSFLSYDENKDNWKHKSTEGNWILPETMK